MVHGCAPPGINAEMVRENPAAISPRFYYNCFFSSSSQCAHLRCLPSGDESGMRITRLALASASGLYRFPGALTVNFGWFTSPPAGAATGQKKGAGFLFPERADRKSDG